MTSSARDLTPSPVLAADGERFGELLSAIAEAPDLSSAAAFLLEQVAESVGAKRGAVLVITPARDALIAIAVRGFSREEAAVRLELERERHPVVASTLALIPVQCVAGSGGRDALPFTGDLLILPFPQPQLRSVSSPIPDRRLSELGPGCNAIPMGPFGARRMGHAPFGALLLEGSFEREKVHLLARSAIYAGPMLARMATVDELRESAQRLDQQRDLLTAIVNSLPDPIVITDAQNNIVVQNRRAEHLLSARDTYSEGRRRAVEINNLLFTSYLARAVMSGGLDGGSRELNLVDPDEGTDLLFEVLAHPLPAEIALEGAYISVLRDVTDLRRAAHELERQFQRVRLAEIEARRERDRLNLILENVADPILVTDDRSNILLMNRHAERLFQSPEDARVSPRVSQSAIRGNDTKFTSFVSDFAISAASMRREQMQLLDPESGLDLPVEVVSGKISNERGETTVIVSVLHDLTKQVENERLYEELKKFSADLEERIREATADLAEQNAQLQWQSQELAKANRLKSEFLASMSHELRTPINALIGYTSLMLDRIYGDLTERQEEGLRRIRTSAEHLLALINDILDLAKIEAGKMPMHYEEVAIRTLITEINAQVEPMLRRKTVEFRIEVPGDMATIHTDRTRVKQIVLNLVSNAVKFTHQGTITLRVSQDATTTRFDVIDTGIGIKTEDLEAIWEDFRQLDQSRTREYGGTGLGLSITKKLVAGLGGRIEVQSTFGKGSTFSVFLPRAHRDVPTPSGSGERIRVS